MTGRKEGSMEGRKEKGVVEDEEDGEERRVKNKKNKKMGEIKKMKKGNFSNQIKTTRNN